MKKIFITGVDGMIGAELVKKIVNSDCDISAIGTSDLTNIKNKNNYHFYKYELSDNKDEIIQLLLRNSFDILIHLGYTVDNDLSEIMTEEIVKKSMDVDSYLYSIAEKAKIKAIILLSTHMAYGSQKKDSHISENFDENPESLYGTMKVESEQTLIAYANKDVYKGIIIRTCPIYSSTYIENLKSKIFDNEEKCGVIYGNGNYEFSLTHINNLTELICSMVNHIDDKDIQGVYNACDNTPVSAKDISDILIRKNILLPMVQKKKTGLLSMFKSKSTDNYREFNPIVITNNITFDNSKAKKYYRFPWDIKGI